MKSDARGHWSGMEGLTREGKEARWEQCKSPVDYSMSFMEVGF